MLLQKHGGKWIGLEAARACKRLGATQYKHFLFLPGLEGQSTPVVTEVDAKGGVVKNSEEIK